MNKNIRTSRETSNTSNKKLDSKIPQWSEASISEEEDIGIRKCRRKNNIDIKNDGVNGSSSEL